MKKSLKRLGLGALLAVSGATHAALIDNLDGTVSDTVSGLMWAQDANLAATNTFGLAYNTDLGDYPGDPYGPSYTEQILSDGRMNWGGALHWIDAMNAASYLGYNDWRLPAANPINGVAYDYTSSVAGDTDVGYNISALGTVYAAATGSELAYMFYNNLDGVPHYNPDNSTNASFGLVNGTGPFINLQSTVYWSGTGYAPDTGNAWLFSTYGGNQGARIKTNLVYGWAVRAGNAGGEGQVPLPGTLLLIGLGALGLRLAHRRAC